MHCTLYIIIRIFYFVKVEVSNLQYISKVPPFVFL